MGLVELLRGPFGVAFLTMSTVLLVRARAREDLYSRIVHGNTSMDDTYCDF